LEIAEVFDCSNVFTARAGSKSGEGTDSIGDVGAGSCHSIHEGSNGFEIWEVASLFWFHIGCSQQDELLRQGGGDSIGLVHPKPHQDLAQILRLVNSESAMLNVIRDVHSHHLGQFPQANHFKMLFELGAYSNHVSIHVVTDNEVINVEWNDDCGVAVAK
jgi:hypothetical protein